MSKVLWTSKNGAWVIETYKDSTCMVSVIGEVVCDYPIMYDNGVVAYDHPERIPAYVKRQVAKILAGMKIMKVAQESKAEREGVNQ